MKDVKSEREEYEKLLTEYEEEIQKLSEKAERTEKENQYLQELLLRERKLKNL
jgi:prefoldin subunit 5